MIIQRARAYGMCFGVRDAIAHAEAAARLTPVTVLGPLVHNPQVITDLHQKGIRVAELGSAEILEPGKTYLITAHGVSDTQRTAWEQSGATLHNTTCPLVKKAHDRLRDFVRVGLHPVVIGQALHVEVLGLTGDYPHAVVISTSDDIAKLPAEGHFGVVSQTTQPIDFVHELLAAMRRARPTQEFVFADTVCLPTKERQLALRELCAAVELVIVIGGKYSNNTKQLCLAAQSYGVAAHQVEKPEELQRHWFRHIHSVGITAGTSTPDSVIDAVEQAMTRLGVELEQELALEQPAHSKIL